MPAKLTVICYAHNCTDRQTRDYTIKEVTGVVRMNDDEPTDVIYLRIKAFIPTDRSIKSKIEEFESGQVIFVRGKFIGCEGWYTVNATSIKPMPTFEFNDIPSIGLSVTVVGSTTRTVTNIDGESVLNFNVEENLGEREPREFLVEVSHDANNAYLANKTNSINQNMRSTTAILVGVIRYISPIIDEVTREETTPGKHVLSLEDISLISTNRNNSDSQQSINIPWLNPQGSNNNRSNRPARGATPRSSRRGRNTLARMVSTSSQNVSAAIEANPIPAGMSATPNNETLEENNENQNQ